MKKILIFVFAGFMLSCSGIKKVVVIDRLRYNADSTTLKYHTIGEKDGKFHALGSENVIIVAKNKFDIVGEITGYNTLVQQAEILINGETNFVSKPTIFTALEAKEIEKKEEQTKEKQINKLQEIMYSPELTKDKDRPEAPAKKKKLSASRQAAISTFLSERGTAFNNLNGNALKALADFENFMLITEEFDIQKKLLEKQSAVYPVEIQTICGMFEQRTRAMLTKDYGNRAKELSDQSKPLSLVELNFGFVQYYNKLKLEAQRLDFAEVNLTDTLSTYEDELPGIFKTRPLSQNVDVLNVLRDNRYTEIHDDFVTLSKEIFDKVIALRSGMNDAYTDFKALLNKRLDSKNSVSVRGFDEIEIEYKVKDVKGNDVNKKKFPLDVKGGLKIDFSVGIAITGKSLGPLYDQEYVSYQKDSIFKEPKVINDSTVKDAYAKGTFSTIKLNNTKNMTFGIMGHLHAYQRGGHGIQPGLTLGVGYLLNQQSRLILAPGISLIATGSPYRFVLNICYGVSAVKRLSPKYELGKYYKESITDVPTFDSWKGGLLIGLSWNLSKK
jgi:hypothetical protein